MQFVSAYIAALVVFGATDLVWLSVMGPLLYRPVLGDILLQNLRIAPAIAFYALFPAGLVTFCVMPGLKDGSALTALLYGALLGMMAYATYDLTNYATLRNWTLQITLLDIVYGAAASGVASAMAVLALRHLPGWLGGTAS